MEEVTKYILPDELYHHGVKGMKWGVRRDKTKERISIRHRIKNRKQEKERQKAYRRHMNDLSNESLEYDDEYNRTKDGRSKLKEYEKELHKMFDTDYYDDLESDNPAFKHFYKVEENYLKSQAQYTGRKLIDKYGEQEVKDLAIYPLKPSPERYKGKTALELYTDTWKSHTV